MPDALSFHGFVIWAALLAALACVPYLSTVALPVYVVIGLIVCIVGQSIYGERRATA